MIQNWKFSRNLRLLTLFIIGVSFVLWACFFIYHSSFVLFDGRRYYALFDDSMISMRYAWNFSHGFGLVWNPGEYVEGYTNPLMTLLMSLSTLAFDKVNAVLAVQISGIVFMLVNAYLVMAIAGQLVSRQEERYRQLLQTLAFLCALSYYPLAYWSLMGMETGLLAVLVSGSVLSALRYGEGNPWWGVSTVVCLGLAFWTRPDAAIYAGPILLYVFWATYVSGRGFRVPFTLVGGFGLFIFAQELFRWAYYGTLLPNTYVLKVTGVPLLTRIENGTKFVLPFLGEVWVLPALAGVGLIIVGFRAQKLLLAGIFVTALCYQVWAGGDPWNYWRILSPAVPLLFVLATVAVLRVALRPSLVVLVVVVVVVSANQRFLGELAFFEPTYEVESHYVTVGQALLCEEFLTENASVGVSSAGILPYYSGLYAVDFLGKSDPYVARLSPPYIPSWGYLPGHIKYDLGYSIQELKPTHAESFRWGIQDVYDWAQGEYVTFTYKDVHLNLLEDSDEVRWEKVDEALRTQEATLSEPVPAPWQ